MPARSADYGDPSSDAAGLLVFGGAFDPPHLSHRRILRAALDRLPVSGALVLPAGRHPLKDGALAPDAARLELCSLAFEDMPGVEVSDLDMRGPAPAYTVDTVRLLRDRHPGRQLFWLIGADNLRILDQWHDHHALLRLATLVTFPRLGYRIDRAVLEAQDLTSGEIDALLAAVLDLEPDAVNATRIRAALARGEVPLGVAPEVLGRIRQLGLYSG